MVKYGKINGSFDWNICVARRRNSSWATSWTCSHWEEVVVDFYAHHSFHDCVFKLTPYFSRTKYSLNSFEINDRHLREATPFSPHHHSCLHLLFVSGVDLLDLKWIEKLFYPPRETVAWTSWCWRHVFFPSSWFVKSSWLSHWCCSEEFCGWSWRW